MKCQHCGINFDDDDRACPICGARAGSRGRMSAPRYTGYTHKTHSKKDCTHQTFTSETSYTPAETSYTAQATRAGRSAASGKKKNPGKWIIAVIALFTVIGEILPAGLNAIGNGVDTLLNSVSGGMTAVTPEPDYEDTTLPLYDVTGGWLTGMLSDGTTVELTVAEGEWGAYTLTLNLPGGTYTENGDTWCDPADYLTENSDVYPADEYTGYVICLAAYERGYDENGSPAPIGVDNRIQSEDNSLWLRAYVDGGGNVVLEDMDEIGLFGDDTSVMLAQPENG